MPGLNLLVLDCGGSINPRYTDQMKGRGTILSSEAVTRRFEVSEAEHTILSRACGPQTPRNGWQPAAFAVKL